MSSQTMNVKPVFDNVVMKNIDNNEVVYKTDELVNKVFKYFLLQLMKQNDEHQLFKDKEMKDLLDNNMDINDNNIKQQLDVVKNLYYDVKKLKNNYMFAYYLSRLSEGRKLNNEYFSYKKYFLYSEYITGLTIDISQINWNQKANIIKENMNLHNIYGDTMHRMTRKFIKYGYISEITNSELIDDVINSEMEIMKESLYINNEKTDDEEEINEKEIYQWYYGTDESQLYDNEKKKRKFEEMVCEIIDMYEKNKKIKMEEKRMNDEYKRDSFVSNIVKNLFKFSIVYCIVSHFAIIFNTFHKYNMEYNTIKYNESDTNEECLDNEINNITEMYNMIKLSGTQFRILP
jgi:hypothetical protein